MRLVQIACSWRAPRRPISGSRSRKAPRGSRSQAQRNPRPLADRIEGQRSADVHRRQLRRRGQPRPLEGRNSIVSFTGRRIPFICASNLVPTPIGPGETFSTHPVRRVLVLADRDLDLLDHAQMRQLTEAARGSHVRLVAPAGALPGERWIIDLAARETQARERLERWRDALAAHARAVELEVGDADARLALADARHAFEPDTVLATTRRAGSAPWPQPSRRRWWQQPGTHALPVAA